jgi:homocysteine S-methyltransferase
MTSNTAFFIGVGANPGATNIDEEVRRLHLKIKNGAEYIMTQPVYEPHLLKRFLEKVEGMRIPILVGILPLSSYRNAEFLHNEVPGMEVPESIRAKLKEAKTIKEEKKIGIDIAQKAFRECRDLVQGVYIMPPFNNVAAAIKIIQG